MAQSKRKASELDEVVYQKVESDYFSTKKMKEADSDYPEKLIALENQLVDNLSSSGLKFQLDSTVAYVYNPLDYAAELHAMYVKKYCNGPKKIMFLGMNPGPWGMCQTGVPFGEIPAVRDFLKISGSVSQPKRFHSLRPITGLECTRIEVSGKRFWGLAQELSGGNAEVFLKNAIVYNYLPLSFLSSSGKNITPADLKKNAAEKIGKVCDPILSQIISLFEVEIVVAIGKYVQKRAEVAIKTYSVPNVKVISIIHPSPANPGANRDWNGKVRTVLKEHDLLKYLTE